MADGPVFGGSQDLSQTIRFSPAQQKLRHVTLTIDHRVLDGFQANQFLTKFVEALEAV